MTSRWPFTISAIVEEAEPGLGPDVVGRSLRQRYDRPSGQRPLAVRGRRRERVREVSRAVELRPFQPYAPGRPLVEADRPAVEICSVPAVETISKTARVNGPRSVESVSVARIRVPHPVRIRLGGTGACTVGHISGRSAETVGLFVGEHSTSPASLCGSLFTEGKRPRAGSESVARPALRVPERMNSGYEPSIRRKYAVYLRGTPQVRIRDTSRRPGRGMIFRPVSSSRRFADGSTVRSISDGPARSECPAKSRFLSERGGFPVLRPDGYSDSLLSEVRTGQVVIRIGSDARDHLRKTRSISRRASFSLMYSRLS